MGNSEAWHAYLIPELLRSRHVHDAGGVTSEGLAAMIEVLLHECPEDEKPSSGSSMSPWLLLARMSAAKQQDHGQASFAEKAGLTETREGVGYMRRGNGDPVTAAAELQLRRELEERISESLHSIDRVRMLLRDPAGSAARQSAGEGVLPEYGATDELDDATTAVDPATILFEGILRSWLSCRQKEQGGGERQGDGDFAAQFKGAGGLIHEEVCGDIGNGGGGVRPQTNDELALSFRCETAGEVEAQVGEGGIFPILQCIDFHIVTDCAVLELTIRLNVSGVMRDSIQKL